MSFASSNPTSGQAGSQLQNPQWRRRHSRWLLAPILGVGMLSFVGFLYVAMRMQQRKYWIIAAAYSVASAVIWTVMSFADEKNTNLASDIGPGIAVLVWVVGIVHGVQLNKEYLQWKAAAIPWYSGNSVSTNSTPGQTVAPATTHTAPLGVSADEFYGSAPAATIRPGQTGLGSGPSNAPQSAGYPNSVHQRAPQYPVPNFAPTPAVPSTIAPAPTQVDVNSADVGTIAALPGLNQAWAEHIVAVRSGRSGFVDMDDFVQAAGLQPHQFIQFRSLVTVIPGAARLGQRKPPTTGRILDL